MNIKCQLFEPEILSPLIARGDSEFYVMFITWIIEEVNMRLSSDDNFKGISLNYLKAQYEGAAYLSLGIYYTNSVDENIDLLLEEIVNKMYSETRLSKFVEFASRAQHDWSEVLRDVMK